MDWPTAAVAVAAALGTSGVAIYSLRHQRDQAEEDRAHDTEMRRQERRSAAYVELMTALEHQQMQVDRTAPIFVEGSPPDSPPSLTDEELWRLNALAAVIASEALGTQITEWTKKWRLFFVAAQYLRQVQEYQLHNLPSETKGAFGVTALEQWQKVEAARIELRNDLRAVGKQVRAEL
jgi:hypothetical protein